MERDEGGQGWRRKLFWDCKLSVMFWFGECDWSEHSTTKKTYAEFLCAPAAVEYPADASNDSQHQDCDDDGSDRADHRVVELRSAVYLVLQNGSPDNRLWGVGKVRLMMSGGLQLSQVAQVELSIDCTGRMLCSQQTLQTAKEKDKTLVCIGSSCHCHLFVNGCRGLKRAVLQRNFRSRQAGGGLNLSGPDRDRWPKLLPSVMHLGAQATRGRYWA